LLCSEAEIAFLGNAYPLLFRLTKYFTALLVIVFVFGGSLLMIINNLECKSDCVVFFGISILNFDTLKQNQELKNLNTVCVAIIIMLAVVKIK